jgi:phage tail sheath protein FI
MPKYTAPGVFTEEVSFRAKSIEGVSTATTGFVGPTCYGPLDLEPEVISNLVEYERVYGGKARLSFSDSGDTDGYMWNAVRAFFKEGGRRCYVARVFTAAADNTGYAEATMTAGNVGQPTTLQFGVRARFPGSAGNVRVTITLALGRNRLRRGADGLVTLSGATDRDIVWVRNASGTGGVFRILLCDRLNQTWRLGDGSTEVLAELEELQTRFRIPIASAADVLDIRTLTATVTVEPAIGDLPVFAATELALDPAHARTGMPDSLFDYFAAELTPRGRSRSVPIVIDRPDCDGLDVLADIRAAHDAAMPTPTLNEALIDANSVPMARSLVLQLTGGNDGVLPAVSAYDGFDNATTGQVTGLKALEALADIAIVAAPGSTEFDDARTHAIVASLIGHAELMRYRIAVVDSIRGQSISAVRTFRALYDSSYAAFYYPWVRILDPLTGQENVYPPSGCVAGIYARSDVERAVYKAPANEVVRLALGFEQMISKAQQDVLNPEGINCFRYFEGRGMRLWGARTMSSDAEWRYVSIRRYFAYLEHSIDRGTKWAVFEPNGEPLWANIRQTVEEFLFREWRSGALPGENPEKAYFVKCDQSTMTQNDLDNGRLICLVGVAALRPAEFVIFRVSQKTADCEI